MSLATRQSADELLRALWPYAELSSSINLDVLYTFAVKSAGYQLICFIALFLLDLRILIKYLYICY